MVAAALTCESNYPFFGVCQVISGHDPTGFAGPVTVHILAAVTTFVIIYVAGRFVRRTADGAMHRAGTDAQVRALLHNVTTVVVYTAAVLTAIVIGGVNVAVLLTAAGVSTVAIGLAFQDILRNVLAGIWLLIERPFRLGDNIAVLDQSGTVDNITLRTTTLKTGDGRLAILPNLSAFSNPVVNTSTYRLRQFRVSVRLQDSADLERILREARAALRDITALADRPEPAVTPQLDGEYVLLRCSYWIDQTEHDPDAIAAEVARRLWRVARAAGPPA